MKRWWKNRKINESRDLKNSRRRTKQWRRVEKERKIIHTSPDFIWTWVKRIRWDENGSTISRVSTVRCKIRRFTKKSRHFGTWRIKSWISNFEHTWEPLDNSIWTWRTCVQRWIRETRRTIRCNPERRRRWKTQTGRKETLDMFSCIGRVTTG